MAIKILALETATKSCSTCLGKDGQPWVVRETKSDTGHAETMTLYIEEVAKTAAIDLKDIDAVAVSQGPGSYTGLRIGVSTAKGLCYALDKPMIAVDTLEALAFGARQQHRQSKTAYVALMDARRMDAYVGIYDDDLNSIKAPYFATLEANSFDFLLEMNAIEQVVLVGDAVEKYAPIVTNDKIILSPVRLPSSKYMTALAQEAFIQQKFVDVAYFEPFYLKQPNITKPKARFSV